MEIKKLNENTTPVGNASKGSEKKFFAKMLDKLGISKFQGWIAERCDARDSKCTYVMHVSKEDQKIIEKVEAIADGINRGVVDGGVPVPYSRSKPGSKQPTAHESGKKFEPTYVMNVSKEDQEIIFEITKSAFDFNPGAFFHYNPYLDCTTWNL